MNSVWIYRKFLFLLALVALVAGCTGNRPRFAGLDQVPEGKALLYLYRLPWDCAPLLSLSVRLDGKRLLWLPDGSYSRLEVEPGAHQLTLGASEVKTLELTWQAQAGEIRFARHQLQCLHQQVAFTRVSNYFPELAWVEQSIALEDLPKMYWEPVKKAGK